MVAKQTLIESLQDASITMLLTEGLAGTIRVRHKVLLLDVETGNGRVYPSKVVEKAIEEAQEMMKNHELLCTFSGHPPEVFPEPNIASHYIVDSWIEDGYLWAESVVMGDTKEGANLLGAIKNGASIGVSVRGVGSVTANRVTEYTYYGFDYVGTPSTGLRVAPDIIDDSSLRESGKCETTLSYIKENSLMYTKNTKRGNHMANVTYEDFKQIINECVQLVESSKGAPDMAGRVQLAESKVQKALSLLDSSTAPFGEFSVSSELQKWSAIKESSVVSGNDAKATSFEPSVGGNPEPIENKNSVAMKASTKESDGSEVGSTENNRRLEDELKEAQKLVAKYKQSAIQANKNVLRESAKQQGFNALYKTNVAALNKARNLLAEASSQLNASEGARKAVLLRNNQLTEGIIKLRKDAITAPSNVRSKIAESSSGKRKAAQPASGNNLLRENMQLRKQVKRLQEEMQGMSDAAKELEKRIDNQSPLAAEATKVAAALELALEETLADNIALKARIEK
jgi:hypothetical protein